MTFEEFCDLSASDGKKHIDSLPFIISEVNKKVVNIRGVDVISDADVADMYGVETKRINEAVKNNPEKFPEDYMFVITVEEEKNLRSKI